MAIETQHIYLDHPQTRLVKRAAGMLRDGAVVVYPTDTIYGLGVDILNKQAMSRVLRIKKASRHKLLSIICPDMKAISQYATLSNMAYRIMNRVVPGPYTFVLRASREIPKLMLTKQKTVGIRIPDAPVAQMLVTELGRPILSTSVPSGEDGYYTNPDEIVERYRYEIDLILDAGVIFNKPSTIVDLSGSEPLILREGAGDISRLQY